jgi:hypothetical protein
MLQGWVLRKSATLTVDWVSGEGRRVTLGNVRLERVRLGLLGRSCIGRKTHETLDLISWDCPDDHLTIPLPIGPQEYVYLSVTSSPDLDITAVRPHQYLHIYSAHRLAMRTRMPPVLAGWRTLPEELRLQILTYVIPSEGFYGPEDFAQGPFLCHYRSARCGCDPAVKQYYDVVQPFILCPDTREVVAELFYGKNTMIFSLTN